MEQHQSETAQTPVQTTGRPWQKHYVKGVGPGGEVATEHQTKLDLHPFKETEPPLPPENGKGVARGVPLDQISRARAPARSPGERFKSWLRFMLGSLQKWNY